jgi:hypothetical protein
MTVFRLEKRIFAADSSKTPVWASQASPITMDAGFCLLQNDVSSLFAMHSSPP